jgi:hypothetical protein
MSGLAYAKASLLFLQVNKNNAAGVALTGASDAVVVAGDCVQTVNDEDITTTEAAQEDGCVTIPERVRRTGQRLTITMGSKIDVDFLTLIGDAEALVSGGQTIGWQDVVAGGSRCICAGSGAVELSILAFYEAWLCDQCIGVAVRGWPSVSLSRTGNRQTQRGQVLSTYQYQGQYTSNSGYGQGPGDTLLPSDVDITGPAFEMLMSADDDYSPIPLRTPTVPDSDGGSTTTTCSACGDLPYGFLSGPYAVGGSLNGTDIST